MSRKIQRISHLLKVANEGNYLLNSPQTGIVHLRRNKNKEWGYIYVDSKLFNQRRSDLLGDECLEWCLPDIQPHISIFTKEEVKLIPENFEIPNKLDFILTGNVKVIEPKEWQGIAECIFEIVICKDIIDIRKKLNFPAYMYDSHEFHITLGVKKNKA